MKTVTVYYAVSSKGTKVMGHQTYDSCKDWIDKVKARHGDAAPNLSVMEVTTTERIINNEAILD